MSDSDDAPYAVGYRKPPAHTRFQPGQSGNPRGRPRGVNNLATDLAQELSATIQVTEGGVARAITKQRAMVKALLAKAHKGDVRAISVLFSRIDALEFAARGGITGETLSLADQEILTAFRRQLIDELQTPTRGHSDEHT